MEKLQVASFLVVVSLGCFMMQTSTSMMIHVVGGSDGWEIPPNKTFFEEWAKPRSFGVGDMLVFPYRPAAHNVFQVSKEDFENCGHDHIINQWATGPTRITLNQTGEYYFYSYVGTHCEMGQKLHITVSGKPGSDGIDWEARAAENRKKAGMARRLLF